MQIEANVVEADDLRRQLAEYDENLCGTKLSPSERALFTRRRKEIYEALHPETRHGAIGNGREKSGQDGHSTERFTADTAGKTGQSERVVRRDATRGERVSEDAMEVMRGTSADKGVVLDRLAAAPSWLPSLARSFGVTLMLLLHRLETLQQHHAGNLLGECLAVFRGHLEYPTLGVGL
ncbi:hypothetical protein MHZ93_06065 [Roseomonas sp. ACRSG]|nr:hypothetical protein [Roseomonas sp. ACRSG]